MASEERKEAFLRAWFDAPEGSHWAHGMSNEVEQGVSDCFDKAIAAWNADAPISPDATGKCGELVTVETQFRMTDRTDRPWGNGPIPEYLNGYAVSRELVTRSQADELLAAERAKTERWHKKAMDAGVITHSDGTTSHPMRKELDDLKADNAAQAARIKELEAENKNHLEEWYRGLRVQKKISDRAEALEAKLAAAEKVREAAIELDEAISDDFNIFGAQQKLRAALGGKP